MATYFQEISGKLDFIKYSTQLTSFNINENETKEIPQKIDNQYNSILIGSQGNPQILQFITKITDEPVYADEHNHLIFSSTLMETGKLYKLRWLENIVGLKKNEQGKIDFYEFKPDKS